MKAFIHDTAVVDPGALIGTGSKVWHFCHVMPKAVIGQDCILGQNVFVGDDVVIGDQVKVQNNVSLYTGVQVEDYVFVGPSAVFTNVINPRSEVERKSEFRQTLVRHGATIGANATIICGVEIGEYAFIGAGAVVTSDVKPYQLVIGNPARQAGWVSRHGSRLDFDSRGEATCKTSGERYMLDKGGVHPI